MDIESGKIVGKKKDSSKISDHDYDLYFKVEGEFLKLLQFESP